MKTKWYAIRYSIHISAYLKKFGFSSCSLNGISLGYSPTLMLSFRIVNYRLGSFTSTKGPCRLQKLKFLVNL